MSEITTQFRTCPLCEATCGLEVTMEGDTIKRIRGDRDDVFSRGFICPKGSTLKQLHEDPDRLRAPLVKRNGTHVEVSWQEAFEEVERLLTAALDEHGREASAIYLGNPSVHNHAPTIYSRSLIMALGTQNIYSASTVDQMPRHSSCGFLYGDPLAIPVPDLDRTDYLLMLGANPLESNGSLCTAPDFPGRMEAIRERGGKVVVVDPRTTKSAKAADEHITIRPGGDAAWLAAIANVIVAEGLVDLGPAGDHLDGIDRLAELVAPFTPEAVENATRIEPETTRRIAREFATAESAAAYGRIGTNTVEFGTLASWLTDIVSAITGNLDSPGGLMWPHAVHQKPHTQRPGRDFQIGRSATRVSGHPEVKGEYPVAALAEEIDTPGDGQLKVLLTLAGNPARSCPDSDRMDAALDSLELMISIDPYLNETTRHAHVILPPPSPLTRSQYDLAFYALSVRNVSNYSPALMETDQPAEDEIIAKLALIAAGQGADADTGIIHTMVLDRVVQQAASGSGPAAGRNPEEILNQLGDRSPADKVLEVMLRSGWAGDGFGTNPDGLTLEKLEENPHGLDFGPLTPQLPGILRTASGRVNLAADPIAADMDRLEESLTRNADGPVLIGRRHLRSNNSWMHNVDVLVKGKERCTLQVHPDDAAAWGLADGGQAEVKSVAGSLVAPVEVTDEISRSVVSLPHGWGHDVEGTRMGVAAKRPGVNSNVLTDSSIIDPLSGNAVLNGIPVTVSPA
jgi:anaerobic selenocysteine-containing dehydrogenase